MNEGMLQAVRRFKRPAGDVDHVGSFRLVLWRLHDGKLADELVVLRVCAPRELLGLER
jgi:hypothetical protein